MSAEGLCLEVTSIGPSTVYLSDVIDGIDGLNGRHVRQKPGPLYVNPGATVSLTYTSSVALSFEQGVIRRYIDDGVLTAVFDVGTTLALSIGGGSNTKAEWRQEHFWLGDDEVLDDFVPTQNITITGLYIDSSKLVTTTGIATYQLFDVASTNTLLATATLDLTSLPVGVSTIPLTGVTSRLDVDALERIRARVFSDNIDLDAGALLTLMAYIGRP